MNYALRSSFGPLSATGAAVIYMTTDPKIDVERLRAEMKQGFAELEGWSSVVSNIKERLKEEQTTSDRD